MTASNFRPVALITGASKGLGRTLAAFLAAQRYHLIITARHEGPLQEVARELEADASSVTALPGDVADSQHRQALADAAQSLGRLDLLVNNASSLGPLPLHVLADYPPDALAQVFSVNVIAPLALVQLTLPLLKSSQGLVVNLSSDAALGGYETWGGYGASKAALDLVSLTLANELRPEGFGVVSVDPGDLRTDMHQDGYPGQDISDRPLPDVTLPFWTWLIGQAPLSVSGKRYQAQNYIWELNHET
jgi:NAD(P)-dependent dehydrogenase (short-subunit alcohol dehydrogenase family)